MPSQGRSPSSRTYRLCTRQDALWHTEQTADARQARRRISMAPSRGRSKTSSTSAVSGNSVPRPIGSNGERQSYSLSTTRATALERITKYADEPKPNYRNHQAWKQELGWRVGRCWHWGRWCRLTKDGFRRIWTKWSVQRSRRP